MSDMPHQETSSGPDITQAFIADRQKFWSRFTSFTTGAVVAVVLLLVAMWFFIA